MTIKYPREQGDILKGLSTNNQNTKIQKYCNFKPRKAVKSNVGEPRMKSKAVAVIY